MLTILGRPSSINVRKVLWTADELGLPYDHAAEWGESRSLGSEDFRCLNPNLQVPVIRDDGVVLWESAAICRYLASKQRDHDLLPNGPVPRAEVEMWMDWQATMLSPACRSAFLGLVRRDPEHLDPAAIEQSAASMNRAILILDGVLERSRLYVAANRFTLADVVIGLSIHRWRMTPIDHCPAPQVEAYYQRLLMRPASRRWLSAQFP